MLLYFIISSMMAACVVMELFFGICGLLVPLTALAGFYCTVAARWEKTVVPFTVASTLLDLSYGRLIPFSLLLVAPLLFFGSYWREHGNTKSILAQAVPGCAIGIAAFATASAYSAYYGVISGRSLDFLPFGSALQSFAGGGCALPLLVVVFDYAMKAFGFRIYSAAGDYMGKGGEDE